MLDKSWVPELCWRLTSLLTLGGFLTFLLLPGVSKLEPHTTSPSSPPNRTPTHWRPPYRGLGTFCLC